MHLLYIFRETAEKKHEGIRKMHDTLQKKCACIWHSLRFMLTNKSKRKIARLIETENENVVLLEFTHLAYETSLRDGKRSLNAAVDLVWFEVCCTWANERTNEHYIWNYFFVYECQKHEHKNF